jgi:hypothetical protein
MRVAAGTTIEVCHALPLRITYLNKQHQARKAQGLDEK